MKDIILTVFSAVKEKVEPIWNGIKNTITNVINAIKNGVSSGLEKVRTVWETIWNTVKDTTDRIFNGIWSGIKNVINTIIGGIEKMVNRVISGLNLMTSALNKLKFEIPDWIPAIGGKSFGINIQRISEVSIPRLKNGGFPQGEDGLFYANHNELVGEFSNGKTAVANNDQIVEGIRQGVFSAVMSALSTQNFGGEVVIEASGDTAGLMDFISFKQKQKERQFN